MGFIANFFQFIGGSFLHFLELLGRYFVKILIIFKLIITPPYFIKNLIKQVLEIGFFSLPVVGLTALFTGLVLALQTYTSFTTLPSEGIIANVVVVGLTRELAPVLTSLMVAGRIASSISAEIGTMKVTEQIDALFTLSINSVKFLVAPRIVAGIICLPLLVLFSDIVGVMGGYLAAITKLQFNGISYIKSSYNFITFYDVFSGLCKGALFGLILTAMGCFFGYKSTNGAQGVGKSTTYSVVASSILIFICDYLLTILFFGVR